MHFTEVKMDSEWSRYPLRSTHGGTKIEDWVRMPWGMLSTAQPSPQATLTPAEAPHGVREAVVLVDLALAWILVNDAQVLVPVRPVHLVHPGREKQFGGSLLLHE